MTKVQGYLRLMRPANVVTAVADILCGAFLAGGLSLAGFPGDLALLCLSSATLYAGGVVFNDVFDAELDKAERPERPIPSGLVAGRSAVRQGIVLFAIGAGAAFSVSLYSGLIACSVAVMALMYDAFAKHHFLFGPINMACCRAANLLLGISMVQEKIPVLWPLAFIPFIYIFTVTFISRSEVSGIIKNKAVVALAGYLAVLFLVLSGMTPAKFEMLSGLPFLAVFVLFVFPPLLRLFKDGRAENVRKTVKAGVLGLVLLDASIAAGYAGLLNGILILLLLPVSFGLARYFAVT